MRTTARATVGLLLAASLMTVAAGPGATFSWQGVDWTVRGAAEVTENPDGTANVQRLSGSEFGLNADGLGLTDAPWAVFTYVDDGASYQGFDLFVNPDSSGARLSGGSLFSSCDGLGYSRFSVPAQENFDFAVDCENPGREATTHRVYVGQRADGTIDWNFDGTWYTSTFLKDNGVAPFAFDEVFLRWRDSTGVAAATFVDAAFGEGHADKDACKKGGWEASGVYRNQGDCVSFAASAGKSAAGKAKGKK